MRLLRPAILGQDGKHPRRVMEALVTGSGSGPELELLQVLGLFDRPADKGAIDALVDKDPIPGLTDHLHTLDQAEWLLLLQKLRSLGLLAPESKHTSEHLDCHPLVRERASFRLAKTATCPP